MRALWLVPLAALALAAGLLVGNPSEAAAACNTKAKAHFVGLGGGDSLQNPAKADCVMSAQAKAGVGVLRQTLDWRYIETSRGHYQFGAFDSWVAAAARHRMHILAVLANAPNFRAHNTAKSWGRPTSYAAYASYVSAVVRRYGSKGTFWKQHRKLPKVPIRAWQVWNEPNLPQYWGGRPNARQYVNLLKAAAKAIRKADPKAEIVTAGLPESLIKHAIQASRYVPQLYKAGGAKWFTTLAVNPYSHTAKGVVGEVTAIRRTMNRHHDKGGKLWISEVGWGTGGPKSRFNIGTKGQAKQLKTLLSGLYRKRRSLKLRGVVYYGWQDRPPYAPAFKDMWGLHTGLRTIKGKPKPSFKVFAKLAPKLR